MKLQTKIKVVLRWSIKVQSPQYLGNDAAELRSILGEGQQVADGTADGVNEIGRAHV